MEPAIREAVMAYLNKQKSPVTAAQVAAALPGREPNSVNRMLRDLVRRGTAVEADNKYKLSPMNLRVPVLARREDI